MTKLKDDFFVIPTEDNRYIVYAPLRRTMFYANENAKIIVEKYICGKPLSEAEKRTKVWTYIKRLENIKPIKPLKQEYMWIQH